MTLHWEWLPLIAVIIFGVLFWLAEKSDSNLIYIMGFFYSIAGIMAIVIYLVLGLIWLTKNIHII
jgi:hypothetical protein